jgi:hypothetical protein
MISGALLTSPSSIRCLLLPRCGISPAAHHRSRLALTRAEREDTSRGTRHGGVRSTKGSKQLITFLSSRMFRYP